MDPKVSTSISVSGVHQDKLNAMMRNMKEYFQTTSDNSLQKLLRDLTCLETSSDCSWFDMSTMSGAQLQMDMYELLTREESTSPLIWKVVSLLQKTCTNGNGEIQSSLSFRYIPLLGRLLGASLTHEKKLRLLGLLQTFTYGISIEWQEPYLKPMLHSLNSCVSSADAKEASLGLSIIVNVLHRNPPAAWVFLRCVQPKDFLKHLINNRDSKSLEFRLEVCKFMILMTDLTESYPDAKEVKKFIAMTFHTVSKCVQEGNFSVVQHTVNFFSDVTQMDKLKPDLLAYPSYESDILSILELLENGQRKKGCDVLLQFLTSLISLEPPKVSTLMEKIAHITGNVISFGDVSARLSALNLLYTLAQKSVRNPDEQNIPEFQAVNQELATILPVLVKTVKETIPRKELITLLRLLCELSNGSTKKAIGASLNPNVMRALLDPIITDRVERAVSDDDAILCVEVIRLISKFTSSPSWLQIFSLLVGQRSVQMALAVALRSAPTAVKNHVLNFPGVVGFSAQHVAAVSQCLTDLETSTETNSSSSSSQTKKLFLSDASPLFGAAEKSRLENVLSRLETSDSKPSDLMAVFEYSVAENAKEQELMNASLVEAHNRIAYLKQRVDMGKEHHKQIRRTLLNALQNSDLVKTERDRALAAAMSSEADAKKAFHKGEEMRKEIQAKLEESVKSLHKLRKILEEKNLEIQKLTTTMENQDSEKRSLEESYRANLQLLVEKDEELKEKNAEIRRLETITAAISEIANGSKRVGK